MKLKQVTVMVEWKGPSAVARHLVVRGPGGWSKEHIAVVWKIPGAKACYKWHASGTAGREKTVIKAQQAAENRLAYATHADWMKSGKPGTFGSEKI